MAQPTPEHTQHSLQHSQQPGTLLKRDFSKIFKNTFFIGHLLATASALIKSLRIKELIQKSNNVKLWNVSIL